MTDLFLATAIGAGLTLIYSGLSRSASRPPQPRRIRLSLAQAACAAVLAVIAWLATGWPAVVLLLAAVGAFIPAAVAAQREQRLQAQRTDALAEVAAALRDAIRSGQGLTEAISGMSRFGPTLLRDEFARVASDARLRGLEAALGSFAERMSNPLADLLTSVLLLNARLGGRNLGDVLDGLARSIRERAATEREARARQTEQRLSARVVAATPVLGLAAFKATNPQFLQPYDSAVGQVVLLIAGGLITLGYMGMVRLAQLPTGQRLLPRGPQ